MMALSVCLGLLPGSGFATAWAQGNSPDNPKLSADLDQLFNRDPNSKAKVNIVVETPAAPAEGLMDQLSSTDGYAPKRLAKLTMVFARVPAHKLDDIAARADVAYVSLDRRAERTGHLSLTAGADAARASGGQTPYDGAGIGIAVLDSGIYSQHISFKDASGASRVAYSQDFTGEGRTDDPYGHGSHVTGVAAANASVASGAYLGVAPNARVVNLRVLNSQGMGTLSSVLSAMDWVLANRAAYNIRVVNLSLGTEAVDSYRNDPLCRAARRLVDLGVVVVAAAGNQGKDSSGRKLYGLIHSPGIDPAVITVGASNTFGTDARNDDAVATYSSRGPSRGSYTDASGVKHYDNLVKPDLVAPGNRIIDPQSPNNYLVAQNPSLDANVSGSAAKEQMYLSGTSMAAPVVAGAAALLLQSNPKLTPNMVKAILMYTAQPLAGFNNFEQGAGQLNVEGAVRLARLIRQDLTPSTPVGAPLLTAAPPTPQTSIAGWTFGWGGGVIMDHAFATGESLITKYQGVYGLGVLLADGTVESDGVMKSDGMFMSYGVVLSDNILTSSGVVLSDGAVFMGTGVLLNDGVLLSDGVLVADGVIMSDGLMMSDGVVLADVRAQAARALVEGDATASMQAVVDPSADLPATPSTPAVSVVSTTQLNLSWKDMSADEAGFAVERCAGPNCTNFAEAARVGAGLTTYQDAGLAKATTYRYRVRAYNSAGHSAYTTAVSGTTKSR